MSLCFNIRKNRLFLLLEIILIEGVGLEGLELRGRILGREMLVLLVGKKFLEIILSKHLVDKLETHKQTTKQVKFLSKDNSTLKNYF